MKTLTRISIVIAASFLLMGGCATTESGKYISPQVARGAATLVCSTTLTLAVKESDRPEVAGYVYAVAQGIRSLSGGIVPTPDQLKATVTAFTQNANAGQWTNLATSIQGIYGGIYGSLAGDPKLALQYLEAIAAGCEDAAAPFLAHGTPTPNPVDQPH